jgi:hypothetical protein
VEQYLTLVKRKRELEKINKKVQTKVGTVLSTFFFVVVQRKVSLKLF